MATLIDLGGASVSPGDGLLLQGRTLYVVRNRLNQIAVVELAPDLSRGEVVGTITDPNFDVPDHDRGLRQRALRRQRALHHAADARHRRTPSCAWERSPKAWRSAKTHHLWDEPLRPRPEGI